MIEKIKKNWKLILIALLVIFSLDKCTQSCTRGQKLTKAEYAVDSLTKVSEGLKRDTAELNNKIKMLNGFNDKMDANIKEQTEVAKEQANQNKQLINKLNRIKRGK